MLSKTQGLDPVFIPFMEIVAQNKFDLYTLRLLQS